MAEPDKLVIAKDLLRRAYEHLESLWDRGPDNEGWQSDELINLNARIREFMEEIGDHDGRA